jgi:hypothetical protein
VHQLWGLSPAVDLLTVFADSVQASDALCDPIKMLQVNTTHKNRALSSLISHGVAGVSLRLQAYGTDDVPRWQAPASHGHACASVRI